MIKGNKLQFFSIGKLNVRGITIHNTNNCLSARENFELMKNANSPVSVHFFVDDVETINSMPLSMTSLHTGKAYDKGNLYTISIEMCLSNCPTEEWDKVVERTVKLVNSLMNNFKLTTNDIYFHNDWDIYTNCPHRLIRDYGSKKEFIKEVF